MDSYSANPIFTMFGVNDTVLKNFIAVSIELSLYEIPRAVCGAPAKAAYIKRN